MRIYAVILLLCFFLIGDCLADDLPALYGDVDLPLQQRLEKQIKLLGLDWAVSQGRLSIALVDITELNNPKISTLNGNRMMYAASLPKIAILFALFKRVEEGSISYEGPIQEMTEEMIRYSSNRAATELFDLVQPSYIAELLEKPEYLLYDKTTGGGLWVGKEYSKAPAWKAEPLQHLVHAATVLQTARFFYMLLTDRLVSKELRPYMEHALAHPGLLHKFVLGMKHYCPRATILRKSGSWETYHSDSAVISHDGKTYIAVALANHPNGTLWLEKMIPRLDEAIFEVNEPRKRCKRKLF